MIYIRKMLSAFGNPKQFLFHKPVIIFFYTTGLISILFADQLWEKALEWNENNRDFNPEEMVNENLLLDNKGKITKRELRKYRFDINGEKSYLYYAELDGKDISIEEIRKEEENRKNNDDEGETSFDNSPFDRNLQDQLVLFRGPENIFEDNHELAVYDYRMTIPDEDYEIKGKIWLDAAEGYPVRQEFTLDPTPMLVNSFSGEIKFSREGDGWGPVEMIMKIDAGALMIRQRIHNTTSFIYNAGASSS